MKSLALLFLMLGYLQTSLCEMSAAGSPNRTKPGEIIVSEDFELPHRLESYTMDEYKQYYDARPKAPRILTNPWNWFKYMRELWKWYKFTRKEAVVEIPVNADGTITIIVKMKNGRPQAVYPHAQFNNKNYFPFEKYTSPTTSGSRDSKVHGEELNILDSDWFKRDFKIIPKPNNPFEIIPNGDPEWINVPKEPKPGTHVSFTKTVPDLAFLDNYGLTKTIAKVKFKDPINDQLYSANLPISIATSIIDKEGNIKGLIKAIEKEQFKQGIKKEFALMIERAARTEFTTAEAAEWASLAKAELEGRKQTARNEMSNAEQTARTQITDKETAEHRYLANAKLTAKSALAEAEYAKLQEKAKDLEQKLIKANTTARNTRIKEYNDAAATARAEFAKARTEAEAALKKYRALVKDAKDVAAKKH